ncbi:MAG: hypothetical protein H6509_02080 [Bryobacterales bacterium]|nr:hypothetical protein [Acidobacteriota bacterium]MCB9383376.1 hypothetical protein [Bryobacterales bacterium]
MRLLAGIVLATALWAPSLTAQVASEAAERERIRALVAAGAMPRNALNELDHDLEKQRLQTQLRTLTGKRELSLDEISKLLDAATRLRDLTKEQFDATLARVDAGAAPRNDLEPAREAYDSAQKLLELAETRGRLAKQLSQMASAEERLDELEEEDLAFQFIGSGGFDELDILDVQGFYEEAFHAPLPISADGDTPLHRSMGLDHTGRLDVAVHPDSDEGQFLISMLESWAIPYIAFRSAVPGQATGPHIHIGLPSPRIEAVD